MRTAIVLLVVMLSISIASAQELHTQSTRVAIGESIDVAWPAETYESLELAIESVLEEPDSDLLFERHDDGNVDLGFQLPLLEYFNISAHATLSHGEFFEFVPTDDPVSRDPALALTSMVSASIGPIELGLQLENLSSTEEREILLQTAISF